MIKGKANIVIDGQWGSTGKGKLAGYLALMNDINASMCDFMSNAGHTFVDNNGNKFITCQLPTAFINTDCILLINPGAAITLSRLEKEIDELSDYCVADRLVIHPHAAIIKEEDIEHEKKTVLRISSTLKGCGGSTARKVMRIASLAKDEPSLRRYIGDTTLTAQSILKSGGTMLLEGAQGFDLSLNHGHTYPYVTSRDVTTMSILNNAGLPPCYLGDVYGTLRTYPIRVGNTYNEDGSMSGFSGDFYKDQKEVDWDYVKEQSGCMRDLTERTTVTNKIRRVFTFSYEQLTRFVNICAPTNLFVNFINHIDFTDYEKRTYSQLSTGSTDFLSSIYRCLRSITSDIRGVSMPTISLVGTGEKLQDMIVI